VKQNKCSKYSNEQISIIRFRTQATNTSITADCANVAYDLLPHNMASATLTIEMMSLLPYV